MKPEMHKTYCCRYYHQGGWWALNITAKDWEDAQARANRLNLQLDGELVATVPARMPGARWWVVLVCLVKNWLGGGR